MYLPLGPFGVHVMLELSVGSSVHCSSFSIRTGSPSSPSLVELTVSLWSSSEIELIIKLSLDIIL